MKLKKNIKQIKGDASFRFFFRNKKKNCSSIFVYSKKDKKTNLLIYDAINKILIKNNILAPKLIKEYYSKNYIEIEDFGNQTIFHYLKNYKKKRLFIFKKIINLLNKIQKIEDRNIVNFKKKNYLIPKYTFDIMFEEAKLFSEWYAPKKLDNKDLLKFKKKYEKVIKFLINKISLKNDVFVHRDFHVSNLMITDKKIAVIDTQDALIGNQAYDLASLIDDVRLRSSDTFKAKLFNLYLNTQKNINIKKFKNDFEIISVLRNLKIIGIFTRLALRDKKKGYLKLIPYAWNLINHRTSNNEIFKRLNYLLDENFTRKVVN